MSQRPRRHTSFLSASSVQRVRRSFCRSSTLIAAAYGALVGYASGQQEASTESSCPDGTPHEECSRFWITEAGFTLRLKDDTVLYPSFEVGPMWNVRSLVGLGLAGYVGWNRTLLAGIKPRLRTWVGPDIGLDLAGGVLCCDDRYDEKYVFSGHVGLSVHDLWAIVLQVERQRAFRINRGYYHEVDAFLGAKLGSSAGLWGAGGAALVGVGILIWFVATVDN